MPILHGWNMQRSNRRERLIRRKQNSNAKTPNAWARVMSFRNNRLRLRCARNNSSKESDEFELGQYNFLASFGVRSIFHRCSFHGSHLQLMNVRVCLCLWLWSEVQHNLISFLLLFGPMFCFCFGFQGRLTAAIVVVMSVCFFLVSA